MPSTLSVMVEIPGCLRGALLLHQVLSGWLDFVTCLLASSSVSVLKNHDGRFKTFCDQYSKFQNVYFHSILLVRWVMRTLIQNQGGKEEYILSIIRGMAWCMYRKEIGEHHDNLLQAWKKVHRKVSSGLGKQGHQWGTKNTNNVWKENKLEFIKTSDYQKTLLRTSKSSLLIIGESIYPPYTWQKDSYPEPTKNSSINPKRKNIKIFKMDNQLEQELHKKRSKWLTNIWKHSQLSTHPKQCNTFLRWIMAKNLK